MIYSFIISYLLIDTNIFFWCQLSFVSKNKPVLKIKMIIISLCQSTYHSMLFWKLRLGNIEYSIPVLGNHRELPNERLWKIVKNRTLIGIIDISISLAFIYGYNKYLKAPTLYHYGKIWIHSGEQYWHALCLNRIYNTARKKYPLKYIFKKCYSRVPFIFI